MTENVTSKVNEKIFNAVDEDLESALKFVLDLIKNEGASQKALSQIEVAVEEIFVNVAHYAYGEKKDGKVTINIQFEGDKVKILFKDSGLPFNPFDKVDPDVSLSANDRGIGGLGIFIVKKTMDNMIYEYKDNMNNLTIIKTIKGVAVPA